MGKLMKLNTGRIILGCFAAALLSSCSSEPEFAHEEISYSGSAQEAADAFKAGQADAKADTAKGILKIKYWGMLQYYGIEKLFKEKYNIELVNVSGYFVSMKNDQYIKGYNSISKKTIQDKYGKDFFEKAYQETLKTYPLKSKMDFYENKFIAEDWTPRGSGAQNHSTSTAH
ncbi:MAG: hypothetical protein ACYC4Q_06925 [Victivallaceae bacterium]